MTCRKENFPERISLVFGEDTHLRQGFFVEETVPAGYRFCPLERMTYVSPHLLGDMMNEAAAAIIDSVRDEIASVRTSDSLPLTLDAILTRLDNLDPRKVVHTLKTCAASTQTCRTSK